MTRVEIDTASNEDFFHVYGHYPSDDIISWVAKVNEEIVAIAGVYVSCHSDALFLNIVKDNLKKSYKMIIIKQLKNMINLLRKLEAFNFVVLRDAFQLGSERFLEKMGFKFGYCQGEEEVWLLCK